MHSTVVTARCTGVSVIKCVLICTMAQQTSSPQNITYVVTSRQLRFPWSDPTIHQPIVVGLESLSVARAIVLPRWNQRLVLRQFLDVQYLAAVQTDARAPYSYADLSISRPS
ncbi:hypothetical protein SCLCIDRAFT_614644 [Scleroderma citrinum Foug A]|uniref:Uncharacterized protein n=1 Tax=Scleroderma citrinum Foug A TaxID=1036808 RepID=A0A0C2ZT49_9AGAM|nr:hypothetical protein SCLCIDRAFT_614644 [Scleroderma citrinum Foug A]